MIESVILIGGLGAVALVRWMMTRPRVREGEDEPEVAAPVHRTLAGITDGTWVTLIGQVRATREPIEAGLSGLPCVAYVVRARPWHSKKVSETTSKPFVVELTDGAVTVDGEIELAYRTRVVTPSAGRGQALLVAHGLQHDFDSTVFEEAIVVAGDRVAVTGVVVRDRRAEGGYRDAPERTRVVAALGGKLVVTQAPKAPA